MASNKIVGITIDIEGKNSGLTKSLTEVNREIKKTSDALKATNDALKLDPTNVDLLAQKEELLGKQISQTNEKLEIMKTVAEDASKGLEEGTVSQEQYAQLTAEIVKTNSALEDLGSEATATGQELDAIDSGDIADVADDAETAADGLTEVEEESGNAGAALDALGGVAAATGAAMVAATAAMVDAVVNVASALADCTIACGDYVDELNTMSAVTGISTESLQEMEYVSGLIDVSVDTMTGAMTKLEKSMSSANEADKKYYETLDALDEKLKAGKITQEEYQKAVDDALEKSSSGYDKLGVSVTDANGNLRDNEEVFWDVIDALGQMESGTERDLLAMELLGKSAKELNPLIEAGSDGFRELADEAHDVGFVMGEETLNEFQAFDDQMERFSKSGTAAKNALGQVLLPSLMSLSTTGTDALSKFAKKVQESGGSVDAIGDAISELLPEILSGLNKVLPDILKLVGKAVDSLLQIFIDNLPQIAETAMSIVSMLAETLINADNISKIMDAAMTILMGLVGYILDNMGEIIQTAIQIITAIVNGISQALPQLIPAAVDAILTICETLLSPDNLSMILDAALNLIINLAMGLVDALPEIIARLPEIISGIVEWLLSAEGIGRIVEAGFTLFTGLVTKMPEIIVELIGALGTLLSDLVDYISGDMFDDITSAFGDIFGDIIDSAFSWGADIIENICDGFASMWDTLTGWIGDIAGAIGDFLGFSVPKAGPLADWGIHNPGADMLELYQEGIEQRKPALQSAVNSIADTISSFLGFSVPTEGPLSSWGTYNPGADMVDLWSSGVKSELPTLQASLDMMASTIETGAGNSVDYSGQLGQIDGTLNVIAGADRQIVIPVYIGQDRIETIVATAGVNNSFISGGR